VEQDFLGKTRSMHGGLIVVWRGPIVNRGSILCVVIVRARQVKWVPSESNLMRGWPVFSRNEDVVIHRARWNSVLDLPAELQVIAGQMSHRRGYNSSGHVPPHISDVDFSAYAESVMLSDVRAEFYYALKNTEGHYWNMEAWVLREAPVWARRIR